MFAYILIFAVVIMATKWTDGIRKDLRKDDQKRNDNW